MWDQGAHITDKCIDDPSPEKNGIQGNHHGQRGPQLAKLSSEVAGDVCWMKASLPGHCDDSGSQTLGCFAPGRQVSTGWRRLGQGPRESSALDAASRGCSVGGGF